jgi:hypothetical protein
MLARNPAAANLARANGQINVRATARSTFEQRPLDAINRLLTADDRLLHVTLAWRRLVFAINPGALSRLTDWNKR